MAEVEGRQSIFQILQNFEGIEPLKELFWSELNYERVNEPLSRHGWTDTAATALAEDPILFASDGEDNDFHIIYSRLASDRLLLGLERPVVTRLLRDHPYVLFIFSNSDQDRWHFLNVKYDQETHKRRLFRRITIGPEERLCTATERLQLLDLRKIKKDSSDLSPLIIQEKHDEAFDVEVVQKDFFKIFAELYHKVVEDITEVCGLEKQAGKLAQLLLDRMLFLYFIQKKGWLDQKPDYLYSRFQARWRKDPKGYSYYSNDLYPLFLCLSDAYIQMDLVGAMPFLNGGLFEEGSKKSQADLLAEARLKIKNSTFKAIFDELLERFNFTVTEDTPLAEITQKKIDQLLALPPADQLPKANPEYKFQKGETELFTLIATDVLAEGLNLQDCDKVINYDLHWNPVRLIQRFGRIDRIGSEHDVIYGFNFLPETGIERNLNLRQKLHNRIQEIHDTIGEDSAILDQTELINEEAMYAIYEKKGGQLSLFEDEEEEFLDLNEAEEILRQLRSDNPSEYERIANLRDGIRSAKASHQKGLYVFCQADRYQQLFLLDEEGNEISRDIPRILGTIKCGPELAPVKLASGYNQAVMRIKRLFSEEVKHRQAERKHTLSLTLGQRYILRELRVIFGNTKDEDVKGQINLLEKAFRGPITTAINRELNLLRRNGVIGNDLMKSLIRIYHQHNMREWMNRRNFIEKDKTIPKIVCSECLI